MRLRLTILFCVVVLIGRAQGEMSLLVYSVKGEVTLVENKKEAPLKIGKMVKPGSLIRIQKDARLTMVCRQGKPLSIIAEGEYPVSLWKDSCQPDQVSLITNYFQYIWHQFYLLSPEGIDEASKNSSLVFYKEGAPLRSEGEEIRKVRIEFTPSLDTVNYTGGDFPLSWHTPDYQGKFLFQLFNTKGGKLVFRDSVSGNKIMISAFRKYLKPGHSYRWLIGTKGVTIRKPRVINCLPTSTLQNYIGSIDSLGMDEDTAAAYFRIGYMLEKSHYLAQAYDYYIKAVELDPDNTFYQERLTNFCKEFRISLVTNDTP